MNASRFFLAALATAVLVLSGCTSAPDPDPTAAPATPGVVQAERAQLTPGPDGKVEGAYPGTRLRVIPSGSPGECRPVNAAERRILDLRGNRVDRPAVPASVDLAEGWVLVASWGNHGDRTGAPYATALLTDGRTFQELPLNGSWLGTHTNAGVAFEGGPDALKVALVCIGAALPGQA